MKLSDGEKLILIMLSDIQEARGIKNSVDPDLVKSAIYYDCTWGLACEYPGIPFEDIAVPETVTMVSNILQMWTLIETGYKKLTSEEKKRVEHEAHPFGIHPQFEGYDSSSEAEELRIVTFLVNHMNRFLNFKGRDFNSRLPLSGRYRRMYEVYEPIIEGIGKDGLSADMIIKILLQVSKSSDRREKP